jgi:hypothetical protein
MLACLPAARQIKKGRLHGQRRRLPESKSFEQLFTAAAGFMVLLPSLRSKVFRAEQGCHMQNFDTRPFYAVMDMII